MRALLLAWVLALLAAHPDAAAAAPQAKRVLLLAPYAYGRAGVDSFMRIHVEALVKGGLRREDILVEFLNLNRANGPDYRRRLRELLLEQYQGQRIDCIVALQQPALDYALDELRTLAPATPIFAIDAAPPAPASLGQHGLLMPRQEANVRTTIEQALTLFPATERLIVAVGASPSDQKTRALIDTLIAGMGLRVKVEYLDGLNFDAMVARAASTPPNTVILAGPVNRDAEGSITNPLDITLRIARQANAPTFTLFSVGIGDGPLGGSVLHIEQRAARSAELVLGIVAGRIPVAPGVATLAFPAVTMYDWEQLRRWRVDLDRLPPDTLFVNRPDTLWQAHRALVMAAIAVIALLSFLSATLLLQRRSLRVAERRFRVLVEHAPEAIVVYDVQQGRFVDANSKAETLFGVARAELLAAGPERFYADAAPGTVTANAERSLAGEELVFERQVRARDGRTFPCEVSLVALPSRSGKLLRAGYVDISERKRVAQELAQRSELLEAQVAARTAELSLAVQDAESANRAKSVFLANMSHELRTPLNSIIGFSRIMAESTSMFDEEKHNLVLINRAGHHLLSLINDILELSKIEAGQLRLVAASVVLPELLRDVHDMLALAARQKGLALLLDCPTAPVVLIDGGKLRQVLLNLLSNAVKFTDAGTVTLSLRVAPAGDGAVALAFCVRDTGIGIAEHDAERIFEPFMQAETPRTQAGTGLGLTISRQFVRLLGGELLLESHPGQGAAFSFGICAALDPHAEPGAVSAVLAPVPVAAADRLDHNALNTIAPAQRQALCAALRQLDMRRVDSLLAALPDAPLVARIKAMLAQHRYPELCTLLEDPA